MSGLKNRKRIGVILPIEMVDTLKEINETTKIPVSRFVETIIEKDEEYQKYVRKGKNK